MHASLQTLRKQERKNLVAQWSPKNKLIHRIMYKLAYLSDCLHGFVEIFYKRFE